MQSKKPQHDIGKTPLAAGSDRLINNAVGKALAKKQICDSILSYLSPPEQVAIMTVNTDVLRSVSSRLHRLVDGDWLRGLYTRERPQVSDHFIYRTRATVSTRTSVDLRSKRNKEDIYRMRTDNQSLIQTYLAYTRQISLAYTSPSAHLLPTPLELFEMCPSLDKIHWYNGFIERRGPPGERQYRIDYDIDIMYPNSPNLPAWAPEHEALSDQSAPPFWFYDHLALRAGTKAFITRKLNLHMQSIQHIVNWENHLVRVLEGPLTGLAFFYPTIPQLRVIVDILARKNLPRAGCLDKDAIIQLYVADWWAVVHYPGWEGVFDDLRKLGLPVRLFVGAKGVSYWYNEDLSIDERNTAWAKLLAVSPYVDELHLFEPIDPLAVPPGDGDRWECDDLRYIVNKDRKKVSRIRLIAYCIRYTLDRPDYWEFRGRQQNQVRSGLYPYAEMFEKMSTKNCHVHLQGIVTTQDGWPEDGMDVQPHDWREWDFVMHDSMAAHQQYYDPDSDYLYPVL